jgi:hypothetical protein
MALVDIIFPKACYPLENKAEVRKLIDELIQIGKVDDYLSEKPGSPFNAQCRHIRARHIGKRLHEIGGLPVMEYAQHQVKKKLGKELSAHLEYAWTEIGSWMP